MSVNQESYKTTRDWIIAVSKALNYVGSILMGFALVFWLISEMSGIKLYLQADVLFPTSIAIIQFPFLLDPESSSKFYLAHSNLLSMLGIISLPFHLESSLFLIAGLGMGFVAFFIKSIPEARNTEFVWSNILIGVGAYFVISGNLAIGTAIQLIGLALASYTLQKTREQNIEGELFDKVSFRLLSVWGWGLMLSIVYWVLISNYYSGFSFLVQGVLLTFAVGKMYHGFWPVYHPIH